MIVCVECGIFLDFGGDASVVYNSTCIQCASVIAFAENRRAIKEAEGQEADTKEAEENHRDTIIEWFGTYSM